jgi:large subunit ribosomal protein L19
MENVITPVDTKTRKDLDLKAGDTVRVWQKIEERGKTRLQAFEGMVLARKHGTEAGATFTVRRNTGGYGVEKIFPLYSPMIDKIEILKRSKTRKSKLYYVREKALKEISKRFKMMFMSHSTEDLKEEEKPTEEPKEENTPEVTEETKTGETPVEEKKEETPEPEEEAPKEEDKKEEENK